MAQIRGLQGMPVSFDRRIPALDGLRGIAILMVAIYHFTNFEPTTLVGNVYAVSARAGWMGVDLFFVLSGFLITGILDDAKDLSGGSHRYFVSFFARRVLRIFPLYYAAMVVVTFIIPALPGGEPAPWHCIYLWIYATNIVQAFSNHWLWDDRRVAVTHFWSLAVEEHFYLVWPMVIGFLRRKTAMMVCAGCVVVAPLIRLAFYLGHLSPIGPYVFTACRMDALAMGGLLALALRSPWGPQLLSSRRMIVATLVASAAGVGCTFGLSRSTHWHPGPTQMAGYSLDAAFFSCLVLLLATTPREALLSKCFSVNWLRTIGKYSYGMYVWHAMVTDVIMRTAPFLARNAPWVPALVGQWIQLLVGLVVSFGLAFISYQLFEKHFLHLKRFFEYEPAQIHEGSSGSLVNGSAQALGTAGTGRVASPPK